MKNKKKTGSNGFNSTVVASKIVSKKFLAASVLFSISAISIPIIFRNNLPPVIPLFYGLAEGENQLVNPLFLTIPAGLGLLIILINTLLSTIISNNFIKRSLILSSFAVSLLVFITTVKILLLVGSF
ncbi:MAG: hypothetical protein US62_C0009G0025 [Candidatus Woesebacteria bacterium GW2011_GWA1_37_8]|uniref:DUF1648 domain-containing protein n=3 Tax=Candidatus Woeseibacteriota TaxID=1752722 RepID=A0A0G0K9I3_9BACT|nr:MAG: hypothetical protein US39_C0002G0065 [Microgenomates group bacterium GW2011_GWC1_37_12b]KKQ45794.1 MAG: hypothetical protein US62_C0009G0025 [Candidatus Woesebacteria bacterium GW2011_GWA1_37_8]